MTTTPPPPSSLPLPGTPVHPRSGSKDTFAPKYEDRNILFARLSLEMSPYFVGPVPASVFLQSFLPGPDTSFSPGMFSALKGSTNETAMYNNLVKAVKSDIPNLSLINTAHKRDQPLNNSLFPLGCQPDCTVMASDVIGPSSGFDSSHAEFFIEFKTGSESDPFRGDFDNEPESATEPESRPSKKMKKGVHAVVTKNRYSEMLPMDMAPGGGEGAKVAGQITAYATLILGSQYRTHLFFVLIVGDYARLLRWDRAGAVVSCPIMYNEESHLFDFLVRYNHANRAMRGHDDSVREPYDNEWQAAQAVVELREKPLLTVAICKRLYVIRAPCAQPVVPVGRWTRTSIAYDVDDGKRVFLKDSWRVSHKDMTAEGEIYAMLEEKSVPNVPRCLNCGDIGDETYHTTQTHRFTSHMRKDFKPKIIIHRHYRLVLDTVGRKLQDFKTSKGVVQAIHASLIAHKLAYEKANVLHRDISAGNIMIVDEDEAKSTIRHGMLIDWDLSKMVNSGGTTSTARQHTRTGTWQFMAADLIKDSSIPQTFVHDLESVFWVLIWIVVSYMPTNWDIVSRSSFLNETMSPKVYGTGGGDAKKTFIMAMLVPSVHNVMLGPHPIEQLLWALSHLLAPRHAKAQKPPALPDFIPKMEESQEMFPDGLRDHSCIIDLFYRFINQNGWPVNDPANLQPRLPSTDDVRFLRTGSERSRSRAESSGLFVPSPSPS